MFGRNTPIETWRTSCPSLDFKACFKQQLQTRYAIREATRGDGATVRLGDGPTPACRAGSTWPREPLLVMGVPSAPSAKGLARRMAIRDTWMGSLPSAAGACFIVSNASRIDDGHRADVMGVDAPETSDLIRSSPRYMRDARRRGRGMPTFKQYAFFVAAAQRWPNVRFVAKIDDDTLVRVPHLLDILAPLRPTAFVGAIHWSGTIPRAADAGVLMDRCAFGWSASAALQNFGHSWGRERACYQRGGVLPLPYGAGAGYVFGNAVLRELADDLRVRSWVEAAAGESRERMQWQKNEDLTTGYWLSQMSLKIDYVNLGSAMHDHSCGPTRKQRTMGLYRPASNSSVLVHGLKCPETMRYAWKIARGQVYHSEDCVSAHC